MMKKILFLIPLLIFSCTKKEIVSDISSTTDTLPAISKTYKELPVDLAKEGIVTIQDASKKNPSQTFRVVEENKIIKTINGDMLPVIIYEELTADQDQFIIKIKNFNGKGISGEINPENSQMNIRFNQIKFPTGDYDGPFTREIATPINESGEVWLIIGKSNMGSGESTGKFSVSLK
ncbi:hypothetical protein [Kaistella polysaccharea]|uniref:hypothetical protein n=1 Tax=Kaistella polysaccharea TaxID=2878534 RepID=UPI001CF336FC|nr:hypothetical protein [Kaistella polysaccharea]